MKRPIVLFLLPILLLCASAQAPQPARDCLQPLHFRVSLAPELGKKPLSGRLLVFMTDQPEAVGMIEPSAFEPTGHRVWITAVEVRDMTPGKPVDIYPDQVSYPAALPTAPAGDYQVMGLLDEDHSYAYGGADEHDLRTPVMRVEHLNPAATMPVDLTLSEHVPPLPSEANSGELVEFVSPSLSAFWGRPVTMRAVVALPPHYEDDPERRYPTVYWMHGFSAGMGYLRRSAGQYRALMSEGKIPEMIYVLLDAHITAGEHEFADSVNNGPWGKALTREFIPHLERRFRMAGTPGSRFVTGHSSGGWSSLWLQVTYPDFFGGTWSTSPDPPDFRDFTTVDLTRSPPENFYRKPDGSRRLFIRGEDGKEVGAWEDFAKEERTLGEYGGQVSSFEYVFSPRAQDGRAMLLFDRESGEIDPFVQKAWEKYDISRVVREEWKKLGPKLRGKIHVFVGTADTFHLESSVRLFQQTLEKLPGNDAKFTYLEGRTHFDLYKGGLTERIAKEMQEAAQRTEGRSAKKKEKTSD